MRTLKLALTLIAATSAAAAWGQSAPSAFTTGYRYDDARQLVGVISPVPTGGALYEAVRNTYDAEGRVTRIERGTLTQWQSDTVSPANWSSFGVLEAIDKTYDVMGRQLSELRSSGAGNDPVLTQYSYDSVGRLECTAIRMNSAVYSSLISSAASACSLSTQSSQGPDRITHLVYDVAGQVTGEQRAYDTGLQQNYATYAYTPNGRQDWAEDANGNRTDYNYDGFDRISQFIFPTPAVGAHVANGSDYEAYTYDNNSNRESLRLRSGETIHYMIDTLNRLSSKDLPAATTYEYDNQGHNTFAGFASGQSISNQFDGFGQLKMTTSASTGSLVMKYAYDEDGNRTRVEWPDGFFVQYTYDGLDRIDQVRENGVASGQSLLADYTQNYLNRPTNINRGNGTATSISYDGISRLASLGQDLASTSRDLTFGFSYNNASQVTQRTLSNDAYAYFTQTQSKSYTPNGLNQYSTVSGTSYSYDGRGNLTSDGSRTFSYDLENHLLSASGSPSSVTLTYDPMGRLSTSSSGGSTVRFLYDGDRLAGEYNGTTLVNRYVHGIGTDEPLVWYEGSDTTHRNWLHADHQGSVIASSTGAGAGTVYSYGPYGEPAYDNWKGSRFRYTGQIMLPEAKLYHYKARVYDPVLGRFLQIDPIGYKDDMNLFAYVKNDPLDGADPTGTVCSRDRTVCDADTFDPLRATIDVKRESGQDDGVVAARGRFRHRAKSGGEPTGLVIVSETGVDVVPTESTAKQTKAADTAKFDISKGDAGVHGHLSNSVVDEPTENHGYGDTQSLLFGKPMYTVEGDRVGVHTAPNGRLRYEMIRGKMTRDEMKKIQENLDRQQKLFLSR